MPDVDVYQAFKELIGRLLSGDEEVAELAATDPEGLLSAYGITEGDLTGVDFRQAVAEGYDDYDLPSRTKDTLDSYVAGAPAPDDYQVKEPPTYDGGHQGAEHAAQHLQYVTYARYENNEHITREIVNRQLTIDSSDNRVFNLDSSVDVAGDFDGDLSVAPTTAAGDGAVANTGDGNAIGTGDGDALAASGNADIEAATGDGAVQADEIGAANTGQFTGVQAGGDNNAPVNTGENDGILSEGDVENAVVGDENQTANLDIDADGGSGGRASGGGAEAPGGDGGPVGPVNLNFGSGAQDANNLEDVRDSAVATDGDATNSRDFPDFSRKVQQEAQEAEAAAQEEVSILPVETEAPAAEELIEQEAQLAEQAAEPAAGALEAEVATPAPTGESEQAAEPVSG